MNIIISGIAGCIVFGTISTIIYVILKNRTVNDPARPALLVSTVLMVLMLIIFSFRMPAAIKERDRREFMRGFRESLTKTFTRKIQEMPDTPSEIKEHVDEICVCLYYKLESNDALVDELIADPDPLTFATRSPAMKKITEECMALYLK